MNPETAIRNLFKKWNSALQTGDSKKVAALYADTAILLPTASDQVRSKPAEILDYFQHFLANGPRGQINGKPHTRLFGGLAINSGIYTFRFKSGPLKSIQARFTFVYQWIDGKWLIIEHHSSGMPQQCCDWCHAMPQP